MFSTTFLSFKFPHIVLANFFLRACYANFGMQSLTFAALIVLFKTLPTLCIYIKEKWNFFQRSSQLLFQIFNVSAYMYVILHRIFHGKDDQIRTNATLLCGFIKSFTTNVSPGGSRSCHADCMIFTILILQHSWFWISKCLLHVSERSYCKAFSFNVVHSFGYRYHRF